MGLIPGSGTPTCHRCGRERKKGWRGREREKKEREKKKEEGERKEGKENERKREGGGGIKKLKMEKSEVFLNKGYRLCCKSSIMKKNKNHYIKKNIDYVFKKFRG